MDVELAFIKGEFPKTPIQDRSQIDRLFDKIFISYQISVINSDHPDQQTKDKVQKQFSDLIYKYGSHAAKNGVDTGTVSDIYFLNNPESLFENNELESELFVYMLEPFLIALHFLVLSIWIINENPTFNVKSFDEAHRLFLLSACEYFSGLSLGVAVGYDYGQETKLISNAKKASHERHKFNRKRSDKLISHFLNHRSEFKSKNEASKILAKIYSLAPKTVREKLNKL